MRESAKALREPLRMGLTVMVLGAAALSLQAWLSNRHVWRTAGFVAASALAKAAIVLVLVLVVAGLLVALFLLERPKGTLIALFTLIFLMALGAGLWGLLLLVRNAPLPSSIGPLATVYEEYARAGISPFTLMHDKRYFWNHEGTAYLAYAARAGAAVVLGPGVGPAAALPSLYAEFRAENHHRGWRVGFYQVPEAMADGFGWGHGYRIGSEAIVELDGLTLEGPVMAKLRHEVSRAQRNGVIVTTVPDAAITPQTRW